MNVRKSSHQPHLRLSGLAHKLLDVNLNTQVTNPKLINILRAYKVSCRLLALQLFKGRLFPAFKRRTSSLSWEKVASFYLFFFPFIYFAKGFTNHECAVCGLLMSHSHHVGVIIQVVIMTGKLSPPPPPPESSNISDLRLNNTEMPEKTNTEASH